MTDISITFYYILLFFHISMLATLPFFFIVLITAQPSSISAIDSSHPFRSGTVYLIDPQSIPVHEEILVNFQFVLEYPPTGIVLSPRVLETRNQTLCIDYNLTSQLLQETGFHLVIKLSQTYPILYNKIIVNYLTVSPTLSKAIVISSLQQHSPGITTIQASGIKLEWRIRSQTLMNQQTTSCGSKHYISKLCVCASANNLAITQKQVWEANTTSVVVEYSLVSSEKYYIDISAVVYANNWMQGNTYLLTRSVDFKVRSQVNEFNDSAPYPTLFIGIKSFKTLTSPSKLSFNFGYDVETFQNNTLAYRQSNPQTYLTLTQPTEANIHFSIQIIGYTIYQCQQADYPNNFILTAQCFKKCPVGRYSSSYKYCINCFDKSNSRSAIGECYENGCAQGYYFDTSESVPKCTSCRDTIPNCKKCKNDPDTYPECQECIPQYFINSTDKKCYLCNNVFEGCQICSVDGSFCLKHRETDQQQNEPSQCNNPSYVDPSDNECKPCSSQIKNCVKCSSHQQFLCQKCDSNFSLYEDSDCKDCVHSVFIDYFSRQCLGCTQYCTQCHNASYCLSCYSSPQFSTRLQSNTCIECNSNQTDLLSQLPLCSISLDTLCLFSKYNSKLNQCEYSEDIKEALALFTTMASFNLHTVFKELFLFVGLFEDFSYYSFHQRNYSKIIHSFFLEMTTFTLTRFKPTFIKAFYTMVKADFDGITLKETPKKIPSKYVMYGKGLHYTTTTQDIWVGSLPMHIGMLVLLLLVRWIIGKFKSGFGNQYNISSFVLVIWIQSNFQYLCFRSFSQLYELTPFNPTYSLNLVGSYSVLLVLLVYSAGGSFLYKSAYQQLFSKGYFEITNQKKWIIYWTANNLLKITISFAHATFFYHPLLQCSLLLFLLLLKGGMFAVFMRAIKSSMEYILELAGMVLFVSIQLLFLIETVMRMGEEYTVSSEIYIGNLEYIMVMMMVVFEVVLVIVKLVGIVASAIADKVKAMGEKKQRQVEGMVRQAPAEVQCTISPINDVSAIHDTPINSLQEVNLENDIAVAIPRRHERLNTHRNGFIDTPNISTAQPSLIYPNTPPVQTPPPQNPPLNHSSRQYDFDFSSVIETITLKIREHGMHKNKSKESNSL